MRHRIVQITQHDQLLPDYPCTPNQLKAFIYRESQLSILKSNLRCLEHVVLNKTMQHRHNDDAFLTILPFFKGSSLLRIRSAFRLLSCSYPCLLQTFTKGLISRFGTKSLWKLEKWRDPTDPQQPKDIPSAIWVLFLCVTAVQIRQDNRPLNNDIPRKILRRIFLAETVDGDAAEPGLLDYYGPGTPAYADAKSFREEMEPQIHELYMKYLPSIALCCSKAASSRESILVWESPELKPAYFYGFGARILHEEGISARRSLAGEPRRSSSDINPEAETLLYVGIGSTG